MTNNYITLHPEKGINPHLTTCVRCGEDCGIALIGPDVYKHKCNSCNSMFLKPIQNSNMRCTKCRSTNTSYIGELADYEKLSIGGVCDKCQEEIKMFEKIVTDGGLFFRCKECNASGVLRGNSDYVREKKKQMINDGVIKSMSDLCGIEFTSCTEHACKEDEEDK